MRKLFVTAALLVMAATGCKSPSDRLHTADGGVVVGRLESIGGGVVSIGGVSVSVPDADARVWGRNGACLYGQVSLDGRNLSVSTAGGAVELPIQSVSAIVWGETGVTSRLFDVPAEAGWLCTHVTVAQGDLITVSAGGLVSTEAGDSSPDGTAEFSTTTALAPQAVGGALVMRIGPEGGVVNVGSGWTGNAPEGGEIYLGVNAHLSDGTSATGRYTAALTTGSSGGMGITAIFPAGKSGFSL